MSIKLLSRFGIPNPRKIGSVIGADRQRSGPSCVLLKRVPQGRTESGGIVLAANAGPRVPRGSVTLKRRCTYRPSVIYLIVNKLLSLYLSLSLVVTFTALTGDKARHPSPARTSTIVPRSGTAISFAVALSHAQSTRSRTCKQHSRHARQTPASTLPLFLPPYLPLVLPFAVAFPFTRHRHFVPSQGS